jgi:DNA helicase HerA-like ATPase
VDVCIPLSTVNRHGLIAGATGTGKTKTLQVFVEQLSRNGIPSMVMDIKGDLSGLGLQEKTMLRSRSAMQKLNCHIVHRHFL